MRIKKEKQPIYGWDFIYISKIYAKDQSTKQVDILGNTHIDVGEISKIMPIYKMNNDHDKRTRSMEGKLIKSYKPE